MVENGCNPDCLPFGINRYDAAPTPTGFAQIVCSLNAQHLTSDL
jgi:hypothetical protein